MLDTKTQVVYEVYQDIDAKPTYWTGLRCLRELKDCSHERHLVHERHFIIWFTRWREIVDANWPQLLPLAILNFLKSSHRAVDWNTDQVAKIIEPSFVQDIAYAETIIREIIELLHNCFRDSNFHERYPDSVVFGDLMSHWLTLGVGFRLDADFYRDLFIALLTTGRYLKQHDSVVQAINRKIELMALQQLI
jgi:hypothetical protein